MFEIHATISCVSFFYRGQPQRLKFEWLATADKLTYSAWNFRVIDHFWGALHAYTVVAGEAI
jgi:hypothetical protein